MRSNSFPAHLASVKSGIEAWTEAVFGHRFQSKGKKYPMEEQDDANSCGVCVISAFNVVIHQARPFTHESRCQLRLEYFIAAAAHLLSDEVQPLPTG